jgi:septal ring factor EnvC (AmiA/AmiB activator)
MTMPARPRALFVALVLALGVGPAAAQPWIPGSAIEPAQDPASRLARAQAELRAASQRVEQASADEARAVAEIDALEARAEEARTSMRGRVRALYRMRHARGASFAGGFDALLSRLGRLERLERIVRGDVHALRYLDERRGALRAEVERAREARLVAEQDARAIEAQRQALEVEVASYAYASAAYLPSLTVTAPLEPAQGYGSLRIAGASAEPPSFAALHGRLGAPIAGAMTFREAVRDDGPGLEFLAPAGTPVRCLADGRVAFARAYGSYGRVVIVEHGGGYYTVYGGLGRIDARVGDAIARGASIGTVGAASEPALFVEVRQGTRSLDARAFLGL